MSEIVFRLMSDKVIGSLSLPICSFSYAIQEAIDMINNFNKSLSNSPLAGGPFAIKFFEKDVAKPVIMEASREYLKRSFPGFVLRHEGDCDERWGKIAVINKDMEEQIWEADQIVTINFDMHWVSFMHTYAKRGKVAWEMESGHHAYELNVCSYDFNCLPFNELDEAHTFVLENQSGWIKEGDSSHVYVPKTSW